MMMQRTRVAMTMGIGTAWLAASAAAGQTPDSEPIPTIPPGVPAVVFPVQSTTPTAGGAWIGGTTDDRETIDLLNAELEFAFGEEEGALDWAFGPAVEALIP